MKNRYKNYYINLIFPAVIFGSITGILTSVVVLFYKLCAGYVIELSEKGYHYLRGHLYLIPVVLAALFGIAALTAFIYKKIPNLRGGGIPTSIGILRGIITFQWLRNILGVFFISLSTFLIGVPLGNEGPSVQMGTAVGRGSLFSFKKKHRAWDRYSMTGGACAGFSVATGAPISGIMFAIEEAHQRISPMIVIVSATSVMFARITTEILAPVFNVSTELFPKMQLITLSIKDIWLPLVVGAAMGLFAVLFLKYYRVINRFFNKKIKKIPHTYKIFFVFAVTMVFGLCSHSFISTGHELILELFEGGTAVYMLLLILLVRSTLTLCANTNSITGGMFLPILALGTLLASILGKTMEGVFGLGNEYYVMILVLGITACISGMMKTPLTAIFFAVESLACYENILYVIIVAATAFIITEIFDVKSINDSVLDNRVEEFNEGKTRKVMDIFVTVKKDSFA
ncbi:MAG: chloride channel protein, partial [Clostridia bacterium]|nr:chloride channel protein [Clostridia bacterium]